jgi:hypothetical protein
MENELVTRMAIPSTKGGQAHVLAPVAYFFFLDVDSFVVVLGLRFTAACFTKRPVIELRPRLPVMAPPSDSVSACWVDFSTLA